MADFAKIGLNNKVIEILVVHDNELLDDNGIAHEQKGVDFLTHLTGWAIWKQSFTDGRRKQPAQLGHIYDEDKDVFKQVKPTQYPSFVYHDETGTWHPPTEKIVDGVTVPVEPPTHHQVWDEETISWVTK